MYNLLKGKKGIIFGEPPEEQPKPKPKPKPQPTPDPNPDNSFWNKVKKFFKNE